MKPKLAWLTLPLALCVLVWGVKWRVDHPTPTKADLEIRALMGQSRSLEVVYYGNQNGSTKHSVWLSSQEMEPLASCFSLSPSQPSNTYGVTSGASGTLGVYCRLAKPRKDGVIGVFISISLDKRDGKVVIGHPENKKELNLHPATTKRWMELLLSHPRIGPQLKAPLKG